MNTSQVLAGSDPAQLLSQAQADLAAGRYVETQKESAEAASLFRASGDRANRGNALNILGLAQLYSGEYSAALDSFTASLQIARDLHDTSNEVVRINNLGNVFYYQGHYTEALASYQSALQRMDAAKPQDWTTARRHLTLTNIAVLRQTLGQYEPALDLYTEVLKSPQALPPGEQAQLLTNIGTLRRRLGDPQKALATYRQAQALYQLEKNLDGELSMLNDIGIVQARDLNDPSAAAATFTNSLQLAEGSGSRPMAVYAHLYRGEALYRAGKWEQSQPDFQAAEDEARTLGHQEEEWKALYGLARLRAQQSDLAGCDALLRRAIAVIESLRASLSQLSLRSDFLADKRDVYDLLIEHTSDAAEVFRLMEQSRARTLQDRLRQANVPSLAELQQRLPPNTAVLEYWIGATSAKTLAITASGPLMNSWTVTPEWTAALTALPGKLSDAGQQDWQREAGTVAGALLPPLSTVQAKGITRLIVIPDEVLTRIPFEALPVQSRPLIEQFTVSYLPAAALLTGSENNPRRSLRWPWQITIEALANPRPGDSAPGSAEDRAWAPLPQAEREVRGIARELAGRADIHIGAEARKAVLTGSMPAPILHLATHALADMFSPARSYILLAPAETGQRYDRLFLGEVAALPYSKVDLVTASACETDAGKVVRGEGVQSFSRAFLAAGAKSVVTSLWAVGDRSTADLMLDFYAHLGAREPKADALRAAKLSLLHRPETMHPAYWAAFVINGESREPIPYVVSWALLINTLVGLLLLSALILWINTRAGTAQQHPLSRPR